jgi:hypothetical protein
MGATFNLADLIPEQMTFRDVDGKTYEALPSEMFGAAEYAKLMRMQQEMRVTMSVVQSTAGQKKGDVEGAAARLEQIADTLIGMIVPDLPAERIKAMHFGHKFRFLNWWREQSQNGAAPVGEAPAGSEKVIRGRRSPASSGSTALTPKAS